MNFEYDFYYDDAEGFSYTSDNFDNLSEVRAAMTELENEGCFITRTFRYINGEFKGKI
tara:strand:+ start:221 stop:394 length:174 start_codon:yes stop_codon:yes gene_type:complete